MIKELYQFLSKLYQQDRNIYDGVQCQKRIIIGQKLYLFKGV